MEFWGVEVKPGETVICDPGEDKYLHLSQASLGEQKKDKGNEYVPIILKLDDQKLVLGTLSAEKCAQISYDLVFEKEFELSHCSKNTSVYFCGYKTLIVGDDEYPYFVFHMGLSVQILIFIDFLDYAFVSIFSTIDGFPDSDDSDSEEDIELVEMVNGKNVVKDGQMKPTTVKVSGKADASAAKADKQKEDEDDEDDEDDDAFEEGSDDDDEDMPEAEDDSDEEDEDESSDEEEEATPQKAESGKKRLAGSASKTPVPEKKKAKLVSPIGSQKAGGDGKKGGHPATPHPAKHAGKTPANSDKSKQQAPKSAGSVTCKSCSKTFNSENALQAHSKAKHGTAK